MLLLLLLLYRNCKKIWNLYFKVKILSNPQSIKELNNI